MRSSKLLIRFHVVDITKLSTIPKSIHPEMEIDSMNWLLVVDIRPVNGFFTPISRSAVKT